MYLLSDFFKTQLLKKTVIGFPQIFLFNSDIDVDLHLYRVP